MPERPRRITQNSLVNAAVWGHDKCVGALIQLGARVNRLDNKRNSALMRSVEKGYETCTDLLIGAGADVNLTEYSGGSAALHRAAANGQTKCLEKLIEAGATVNLAGSGGLTALHLATENDHQECFEKLMEAGANVNLSDGNGCTPLHKAAENKCKKYLEKLIQNNANVDAVDANGQIALLKAAEKNFIRTDSMETDTGTQLLECIQIFLKVAENNFIRTDSIETDPGTQSLECIQILLKAGAAVNIADNSGRTPLSRSAECGDQKAIEILLQNRANIDAVDANGNTALMKTVQKKHMNCLLYLINQGADVNIANKHGMTPLVVASGYFPSVVVLLIDKGANVNVKTSSGKTPLYYLASNINDENFEMEKISLDILITAGADVNLADSESGTALMSTIKYDNKKTFTYLLEKGADTNIVSRDCGRTAMHYAVQDSKLEYMQSLIEHGACVYVADNSGEIPLMTLASKPFSRDGRRTINCLKLLLKTGAIVNYLSNKGINATGALLTADVSVEKKYDALMLLYAAGETHENVIVDCYEKLIVLPNSDGVNLLDTRMIKFVPQISSYGVNGEDYLPSNSVSFKRGPESRLDTSLMNFCRQAVRKHLLHVNRNKNLFDLVPKLPLVNLMTEYLLYGMSLNF